MTKVNLHVGQCDQKTAKVAHLNIVLFPSQITLKIKGTVEFTQSFCLSQQSTERKREHSAGSKKPFDPPNRTHVDRISKTEAVLHLHRGTEVQNKDKEKMHHILAQGKTYRKQH